MVRPRGLHRCAGAEHHHNVGVDLLQRTQQLDLVRCYAHIAAVQALALFDLVQAHAEQHYVSLLGQRHGFGLLGGVGFALAVETGGKSYLFQPAFDPAAQQRIYLDGVDRAGACALVARGLGKVADDGNFRARRQRQQVVLVFQQHRAFGSGAAGQRVVCVGVKAAAVVLHSGVGVINQRQQFVQASVHIGLGDLAGLDSGQQFPHGVTAGSGHFQRGAVLYAQCMVVGAAPVGNDSAGKAPIPA